MAVYTVEDIQKLAEDKLDKGASRYIALGAGREQTLRENTRAFQRIRFRPQIFVDVEKVNTSATLLGQAVSLPVGLAPSAAQKIMNPEGEIGSAKAAQDAGVVMILSSLSTLSLEAVKSAAPGCLLWQQTYIFRDRSITQSLIERAAANGFSAIVVTADSPVPGDSVLRHSHLAVLPRGFSFANIERAFSKEPNECEARDKYSSDMDVLPSATWDDIEWLRRHSRLPVVIKGVLTAEAALTAHRHGAAAVIVSNHGGRQLDGTPVTGQQGVERVLQIFREELVRTMQLLVQKKVPSHKVST